MPRPIEAAELVEVVARLTTTEDWVSASLVARALGISTQRATVVLAAVARAGKLEVAEPNYDHRVHRYRPVGHVPRRPHTAEDWRRVIDASPQLTSEDRRVLEVAEIEGVKPSGFYRSRGWMAAQLGLSTAGFDYRWWRAVEKLGWRVPPRHRLSGSLRRRLVARAVGERAPCDLCGHAIITSSGLAVDHVVRKRDAGNDDPWNLRVVHLICNMAREHKPTHATLAQMEFRLYKRAVHGSPRGVRVQYDIDALDGGSAGDYRAGRSRPGKSAHSRCGEGM